MLARDMKPGKLYRLKSGEVMVFSRIGGTGLMVVHPPGEPDMQSSFALAPTEAVEEAGALEPCDICDGTGRVYDGPCPNCAPM